MTDEYNPSPIYAYHKPKPNGGFRNLFPPSAEDRKYQRDVILPILEDAITPLFSPYSYAFQKDVPLYNSILYLKYLLEENGYKWAIPIDINKYFDKIDREVLYSKLEPLIPKDTLEDIKKSYSVPYCFSDGKFHVNSKGIYQGSPISPVLSNLILTDFDFDPQWNNSSTKVIRYCDDILILTKGKKKAVKALSLAKKDLYSKGFSIKPTKPINLESGYIEFLGFKISKQDNLVDLSPKDKNYTRMVEKLHSSEEHQLPSLIRGWIGYYSLNAQYTEGYYKIQDIVFKTKGIDCWISLTEKGLIPYPNSSNDRQ